MIWIQGNRIGVAFAAVPQEAQQRDQ
jgi:hypothetical protein